MLRMEVAHLSATSTAPDTMITAVLAAEGLIEACTTAFTIHIEVPNCYQALVLSTNLLSHSQYKLVLLYEAGT